MLRAALAAVLMVAAAWTAAADTLQPIDTSSPRRTLSGFLENGDAVGRFYRDVYHDAPTFANLRRLLQTRLRGAYRVLDLSETPPALRDRVALDASVHLYEVLSRIELPPAAAIPGDESVAGAAPPARWTVPHTDITLVRVTEGPRRGDYLFSPEAVQRSAEYYALV